MCASQSAWNCVCSRFQLLAVLGRRPPLCFCRTCCNHCLGKHYVLCFGEYRMYDVRTHGNKLLLYTYSFMLNVGFFRFMCTSKTVYCLDFVTSCSHTKCPVFIFHQNMNTIFNGRINQRNIHQQIVWMSHCRTIKANAHQQLV